MKIRDIFTRPGKMQVSTYPAGPENSQLLFAATMRRVVLNRKEIGELWEALSTWLGTDRAGNQTALLVGGPAHGEFRALPEGWPMLEVNELLDSAISAHTYRRMPKMYAGDRLLPLVIYEHESLWASGPTAAKYEAERLDEEIARLMDTRQELRMRHGV